MTTFSHKNSRLFKKKNCFCVLTEHCNKLIYSFHIRCYLLLCALLTYVVYWSILIGLLFSEVQRAFADPEKELQRSSERQSSERHTPTAEIRITVYWQQRFLTLLFHHRLENRNQLHFNDTIPVLARELVPPYTHANIYALSSPCCFIISDYSVSSQW